MNFDHHIFSNLRFVCLSFGTMLVLAGCANDAGRVQRMSNGFASVDGSTAQPPSPESDAGVPSAGLNRFPQLGELRISEILFDPNNGLEDIHGEWVEIENVAQEALTLDDCRLTDSAHLENRNAQADLSGIVLDPGALILISRSADTLLNGGLVPDAVFTFGLGNGGDTVLIKCGDTVMDEVAYDSGAVFPKGAGRAIQRGEDRWCPTSNVYHAPTGQKGTPGRPNPPCVMLTGQCWSDADCDAGQRCVDDACTRPAEVEPDCEANADCEMNLACENGSCIEIIQPSSNVRENELIISEFLYDPVDTLSDLKAEWIELKNASDRSLELTGCFVADNTDAQHWASLEGIRVEPAGFVLIVRSDSLEDNGGLTSDAVFRFNLNNSGDDVRLICEDIIIDQVSYGTGGFAASGASLSRSGPVGAQRNESGTIWCVAQEAYITDPIHAGSPGAENPPCP
jgi:hypothetical protein